MGDNPILDFGIDRSSLKFIGEGLQRPECILAEKNGVLWSADARGGVVELRPDGSSRVICQRRSKEFQQAGSEVSRYLKGALPNGLAFADNCDILVANCNGSWRRAVDGQRHIWRSRSANSLHRLVEGLVNSVF